MMLNPYGTEITRQHHTLTTREGDRKQPRKDWADNGTPEYRILNKVGTTEQ